VIQFVAAEQSGHMRVLGPAEHSVQFDIGVDPGADAAEYLQDGIPLEDHTGVALLGV
jgi:hypothetical protein